jgi:hypothetical protein
LTVLVAPANAELRARSAGGWSVRIPAFAQITNWSNRFAGSSSEEEVV